MEELLRKRASVKGSLTRLQKVIETPMKTKKDIAEMRSNLDTLDTIATRFEDVQDQIEVICDATQKDQQETERSEFEQKLRSSRADIQLKLNPNYGTIQSKETSNTTPSNPQAPAPEVRLPKIDLPTFSGSYAEWTSFKDLFSILVHSNSQLKDVQKLQYLKTCVKGDPLRQIQALGITEVNYKKAWDIICLRYDNQRRIANTHYQAIVTCPSATQDTPKLRQLADTFMENIKAVENIKADTWNNLVVYLLTEKLDTETRKLWEMSLENGNFPKLEELQDFIYKRCQAIEVTTTKSKIEYKKQPGSKVVLYSQYTITCPICKKNHKIYSCERFMTAEPRERWNLAKRANICYNCLSGRPHQSQDCSHNACRTCGKHHHTLLHTEAKNTSPIVTHACISSHTMLPTVQLTIQVRNKSLICRALLDSGAQVNLISQSLSKVLNATATCVHSPIIGIGGSHNTATKGKITATIRSLQSAYTAEIDAYIIDRITTPLPTTNEVAVTLSPWERSHLADQSSGPPSNIDLLLSITTFMDSLRTQRNRSSPFLLDTAFGLVIAGQPVVRAQKGQPLVHLTTLDDRLQQFWKIEEVPQKNLYTEEERRCEEHFLQHHRRLQDGRYQVRLPFKDPTPDLGSNKIQATRRLQLLEAKLQKHKDLHLQYSGFLKEYESLKHMQLSPQQPSEIYYLPHHAVLKETSISTKLRVVFDASATSNNGKSLNTALLVGAVVQPDLIDTLLRFRTHPVGLIADITKMYRQIMIHPDDRKYQKILWRDNPQEPLKEYELTTVTYGTAAAPHLATRTLLQLAQDEEKEFPIASAVLKNSFYVDDCVTGALTESSASSLQQELQHLLKRGGFTLAKWASNSSSTLRNASEVHPDTQVAILGMVWDTKKDTLSAQGRNKEEKLITTKRSVLAELATVYDPLGLTAPLTITAKLFMQQLWLNAKTWDEPLSEELSVQWSQIRPNLLDAHLIHHPRFIGTYPDGHHEIHGFCDASEKAYGAVVYIRTTRGDQTSVNIICSKSRVAPLKAISLPRLELCGAVLLANLIDYVKTTINIPINATYAWTDSTVTLSWIQGESRRWKTFVANRVSAIQELVPPSHWRHVKGTDNPADLVSRGTPSSELMNQSLWSNGPPWLKTWTPDKIKDIPEDKSALVEIRAFVCRIQVTIDNSWMTKYSSWNRLIRITAWIYRFINRVKHHPDTGELSAIELDNARVKICKLIQDEVYRDEIKQVKDGKLQAKSVLSGLHPFVESELLRVGGRITNANVDNETKHPIILPAHHHVTKLLISHEHKTNCHLQATSLTASLRQRYWIPKARSTIRKVIHSCIPCFKERRHTAQQLMGNLPSARVQQHSRPFLHCGTDYAGPINIRTKTGRGRPITTKGYIVIFICLSTKAIHLEAVSELTASACLATIRRFAARRGWPSDIYSDQGTNFKAVAKGLSQQTTQDPERLIQWHFNPPSAPHFGGLWEAGVKSVKTHLKRTMGNELLTFEELYTLLTQIEAILNSRPLCPLTDDPDDLNILTPGHFLIGAPLTTPPVPGDIDTKSPHQRWEHLQRQIQAFWKKWSREYLTSLQQRPKWRFPQPNLSEGTMVIIQDDNAPPTRWKIARIIKLHKGSDGLIRVVTLRTPNGTLQRPIYKLSPLPLNC